MSLNPTTIIGKEIGGFLVTSVIGEGATAFVLRGESALDASIVRALKVVRPELSALPEFVARFTEEARTLDRLQHPNVVRFHGIRREIFDGIPLLIMELEALEGRPLCDFLAPGVGPLPVRFPVGWYHAAAEGVAAAHDLAIVHRDLKPANLFLTTAGQIKVLDFGIARVVDDANRAMRLTVAGKVPGTPAYMAPEACFGANPTAAADVYSLGIGLFELLAGRHPYAVPGQTLPKGMAMMVAQVKCDVPPLRSIRPDVPEAVERIVAKATAKEPARRYSTARELSDDLGRARCLLGDPAAAIAVASSVPPGQTPSAPVQAPSASPGAMAQQPGIRVSGPIGPVPGSLRPPSGYPSQGPMAAQACEPAVVISSSAGPAIRTPANPVGHGPTSQASPRAPAMVAPSGPPATIFELPGFEPPPAFSCRQPPVEYSPHPLEESDFGPGRSFAGLGRAYFVQQLLGAALAFFVGISASALENHAIAAAAFVNGVVMASFGALLGLKARTSRGKRYREIGLACAATSAAVSFLLAVIVVFDR